MAERFATQITIGGALRRCHVRRFLEHIAAEEVSIEWGDAHFEPNTVEELQGALHEGRLRLCDDQRSWGEFADMEAVCRRLRLGYTRWTEGRYEYDAELVEWRPGMRKPCVRRCSNGQAGATYVASTEIQKAIDHLAAGRTPRALRLLKRLCPQIAHLPPLEIVP